MSDRLPSCVCPHARYVNRDPSNPKIACGVMEADQKRADPIMEGAPVGVIIVARDDPSTFFGWCTGDGEPTTSPDRPAMHYSACPIYAAEKEWTEADRLFAPSKVAEPDVVAQRVLERIGGGVSSEGIEDVNWMTEVVR